jgi:hypothetical protein
VTATAGKLTKRDFGESHGVGLAAAFLAATADIENAQLTSLNVKIGHRLGIALNSCRQAGRWIRLWILLTGMLFAYANVSRFERESLAAHGQVLDGARQPLYYSMSIELDKSADDQVMVSLVKLTKDAPSLALTELRLDVVAGVFGSPKRLYKLSEVRYWHPS